jgi:DNA-directed RNA polymerase specialized sigma24 family protein
VNTASEIPLINEMDGLVYNEILQGHSSRFLAQWLNENRDRFLAIINRSRTNICEQDREDVLQIALEKLIRAVRDARLVGAEFLVEYFTKILKRSALDYQRNRSTQTPVCSPLSGCAFAHSNNSQTRSMIARRIYYLLDLIRDQDRGLMVEHISGERQVDIAEALGKHKRAIMTGFYRMRQRLLRILVHRCTASEEITELDHLIVDMLVKEVPLSEIAEKLNLTVQAVKSILTDLKTRY